MNPRGRNLIVIVLVALLIGATAWALSIKSPPRADFTFVNNTEIRSIDPALAVGQPEGRVIMGLFEGLTDWDPQNLNPIPGVAESWDISPDRLTYTFHIRKDAKWSDGSPLVADDFVWQWRRMLDLLTASEYTYQLWYLENAERYTNKKFGPGDPVEIELFEHEPGALPYARGKVVRGKLVGNITIHYPAKQTGIVTYDEANSDNALGNQNDAAPIYVVQTDGKFRLFQPIAERDVAKWSPSKLNPQSLADWTEKQQDGNKKVPAVEPCRSVLLDFNEVGAKAIDDHTLQIKLHAATPYILQLMGFYPLCPTNRRCVETYGYPAWTKPEHVVTNGPFKLESRVVRSSLRMVKNPYFWNAKNVKLNTIDVIPIESSSTALNMYLNGEVDWIPLVPTTSVPDLIANKRTDFLHTPEFTCDFYRINCTKPPLNNKLVRQALALAVDKRQIVEGVIRGGEVVARSCVPPGIPGYEPAECPEYNPERARELLAEAGYPGGRGFPKIEVVYNSDELNESIVQVLQDQWKKTLGIDIGLQNMEWNAWLENSRTIQYDISRGGWIGDYLDPNTFLDMWLTDGGNNQTGWSNKEYDKLIAQAGATADPAERFKIMHQAEAILMDEMPIIPIYYRVSRNMVRNHIKGFYPTLLDLHPLDALWIDEAEKKRFLEAGGRG